MLRLRNTFVLSSRSGSFLHRSCRLVFWPPAKWRLFFDRQILLSMRKKMVKEDSLVAESITSNFKYSHQPGKRKKIFVSLGKFITRWKKKKFYITCLSCESFKIKPFLFAEKIPFELWTNKILLRDMEKRVTSLFQYWCHF